MRLAPRGETRSNLHFKVRSTRSHSRRRLYAARWDKGNGALTESEPKKLFAALPVLYATIMTYPLLVEKRKTMGGERSLYEAPCYRYPFRNDRTRVFQVFLPCKPNPPEHWIMRGMCLLCITAQQ